MKKHSFTLVELIAAMSIMLMVALIISTAASTFFVAYEQSEKLSARLNTFAAVNRVADRLICNSVPFVWQNEEDDEEQLVFLGEPHELLLCALTRTYIDDDSGLLFARLYLQNTTLYCDYSGYPILPWLDMDQFNYAAEPIAENVQELNFSYYTFTDGELEKLDEWDTEDTYSTSIPAAIQMELVFTDGTKERWLRRTAGNSYNSSFGQREEVEE